MAYDGSMIRTKVLVREVMNSPVITVKPTAKIDAVAKKMVELGVGSIVVMEKDKPIGIITDTDIVKEVVAKNAVPSRLAAAKIMSSPLHTIESTKDLSDVARLMRKLRVKRLGVTKKGDLVGIVSVSDVLSVTPELIDIVSEKARIMMGESRRVRGYVEGYCDNCGKWSEYLEEIDNKYTCEECRLESATGELPEQ